MKEIEQGTKLKHVQPNEKIHMPTKEGKFLTTTGDMPPNIGGRTTV